MTAEEKLVKRIHSAGSAGIKKTDLRKELGDIEAALEEVISRGEVFVDKRAGAYYCFHKTHYIQSLLNSDPRFKLTYDMIQSLQTSVTSTNKELGRTVEVLANNISNLARFVLEIKNDQQSSLHQQMLATDVPIPAAPRRMMSVHDFKEEFDVALANSGSSIGWVELAKLRNELCDRCNITADEFYRLVGELTSMHQERYELSTGGSEGVMVRGLLHGLVRCI
ncbi:MAG TPA: hypothetical protein VLA68_01905 [Nitrososphaera sp.]|nr:hypothetical protein [Nitrososphaera sp.]